MINLNCKLRASAPNKTRRRKAPLTPPAIPNAPGSVPPMPRAASPDDRDASIAADPAPAAPGPLLLAQPQAAALLSSFTNFLAVAIHSILYYRKLYPQTTFLTARAYNLPVHQSRHPGVCAWIQDAVAAAAAQVRSGSVRQIALVVHAPRSFRVVERWIFDLRSFPAAWGDGEAPPAAPHADDWNPRADHAAVAADDAVSMADVHEALRGALSRLSDACKRRPCLPEGCTFTLGVELRDQALPPTHHPQLWIPSQPSLQAPSGNRPEPGRAQGAKSVMPVRSVQAGPLFFECWVEHSKPETTSDEAPGSTNESSV
ncbi:uncharacterized protein UV8b_06776 [Ustilaginoidea virens]|uniref:HORMA domain-containing protein n=1 Tax=Ustilaginoidea virens TaxID=1159556 RepID=A0A8E5HVR2_USTVR|nr:uncharacterized protein UV8b_06776 [Ustilaginoidea virens]QUC22535.1 hypothetical protein UV8b_06776 [Ustilaginoidea virens]